MFFVIQKKHKSASDTLENGVINKSTENEAKHQFHAFMSTYAYGQDQTCDYLACSVENDEDGVLMKEIDDRRPVTNQEEVIEG